MEGRAGLASDGRHVGLAQPRCRFDERIEHGLELEGRAADDLQNLRRRGLLLQQLLEVAGACLHFVEQAYVLDRDHRLIGEGRDEVDLLLD